MFIASFGQSKFCLRRLLSRSFATSFGAITRLNLSPLQLLRTPLTCYPLLSDGSSNWCFVPRASTNPSSSNYFSFEEGRFSRRSSELHSRFFVAQRSNNSWSKIYLSSKTPVVVTNVSGKISTRSVKGQSNPPDHLTVQRRWQSLPWSPDEGRRRVRLWMIVAALLLVIWLLAHVDTVPISGRKRIILVSKETEKAVGDMAWQQILAAYGAQLLPQHSKIVEKISKRLILASGLPELKDLPWEFHVILSKEVNAFVLPGGKVCVFTGILPVAENEDGLATVLGHEIGHVIARHGAEQLGWQALLYWANVIAFYVFGIYIPLGDLARIALGLKFSRAHESEADHIGLLLMGKACYNPESAVGLWTRMAVREQTEPNALVRFLSTHPPPKQRIQNISSWLPEAEKEWENSSCPTVLALKQAKQKWL